MKTNILITGTGFVSTHLTEYFNHKEDTKVTLCSRNKEGENIIKADLSDLRDCTFLKAFDFDKIFHLSAQSSVHVSVERPFDTIRSNINSVNNFLEVFAGTKTKLIFAGSSEVYKDSSKILTEESELESQPKNIYALSRLTTDNLIRSVAKDRKIDCTLLRLFLHTGSGHSTNFALSSWAKQLADIKKGKQEKKIYVGNLQIQRSYCDVHDVCRAYDLVSDANDDHGEVYNVCSGQAYLMKDLLKKLVEIANVDIEIIIDEKRVRKNDIMYIDGSYKKIKEKFGWEPLIPIEQTLKDLYQYWEQYEPSTSI